MTHILHFVSSLSKSSGLMSVIMNYYRNVDREKIQFGFLYFKNICENTYEDEIIKLGGECILIDANPVTKIFRHGLAQVLEENNHKYDILHVHEVYLISIVAPIARKHGVVKIVSHAHTTKFSDRKFAAIRNQILSLPVTTLSDGLLACSREAGEVYFRKSPFQVLNNAICLDEYRFDTSIRKRLREQFHILDETIVVGNVGRLCNQKNQLFLLDLFSKYLSKHHNALLFIIGEGPLEEALKNRASELKISESVIFLGKRSDVNDLYNAMDIFVLPSVFEGLGVVLIEAQANGLPCISSLNVPREAVITRNHLQISLNETPTKWAEILEQIDIKRDESATDHVRKNGYEISDQGKWLENYYISLLEE